MSTLTEWLGDGGLAVPPDQAARRASRCSGHGRICPKNRQSRWWEAATKSPVAEIIRRTLEVKNGLDMRVPNEKGLGICDVCGCCLPLKVHVPLDVILKEATMDQIVEFESVGCWITNERNAK